MAGFCELAIGLRAPKLGAAGAKSPIVSGGHLKYSRFRETATGDGVRSRLRGGYTNEKNAIEIADAIARLGFSGADTGRQDDR
jgi:hypothetical protein